MTYKEMFDNNDIELFLQWCRFPLQEIVDRVQKSIEVNEEEMFCNTLSSSDDFNCNDTECRECLLNDANNQKLLEWLNKNSTKVEPRVGIGANIKDMEKEKIIPEPRFKVGDTVTFKSSKDCIDKSGNKKYWFGGINFGGIQVKVKGVCEFIAEQNCYKIQVDTKLLKEADYSAYSMLECEFVEYDKTTEVTPLKLLKDVTYQTLIKETETLIVKNPKQFDLNSPRASVGSFMIPTKGIFQNVSSSVTYILDFFSYIDVRPSTKSEIYWLEKCIKHNKFLPLINPRFQEGDLVVVINYEPSFKGEVLKLGGKYWTELSINDIQLGDGIAAISRTYPEGSECSKQLSHTPLRIRFATQEEINRSIWAKVITEEPIAKKGDYVVLLEHLFEGIPMKGGNICVDYCYCLSEDFTDIHSTFRVEKDRNNYINNAYTGSDHTIIKIRLATSKEIKEYQRLGKPFDVIKFKTKYLPNLNNPFQRELKEEYFPFKAPLVPGFDAYLSDDSVILPCSNLPDKIKAKNKYLIEIQEEEPINLGSKPKFKQLIK